MKRIIGYIFKCIVAGIISLVLLSLFSMVYYNPPIATEQPDGITNYKYISDRRWSYMTEGFGFGRTDNIGYNNAYYEDLQEADIVLIGSSHMEALNVPEDANCVYQLNKLFAQDDSSDNDYKCLNLGISGHFFEVTSSYFPYVAENFKGIKYLIIEVFNTQFTPETLDGIIAGEYRTPYVNKGVVYETAKKIPYLSLMYKKIGEMRTANSTQAETGAGENSTPADMNAYTEKMNTILEGIKKAAHDNGIEPLILMHDRFWEDENRNIVTEMDSVYKSAFINCCNENGLYIIDVTPAMIEEYKESYQVSYGFANSVPGEGHLNKTGHRIIAEVLYEKIGEMEESK